MLVIIYITDLKPICSTNYITKYVDDSSHSISETYDIDTYDIDLSEELRNALKWVEHIKMQVNMANTKENVFHMSNARNVVFPSELHSIERVLCIKLVCVWLQADMCMWKHVDYPNYLKIVMWHSLNRHCQ